MRSFRYRPAILVLLVLICGLQIALLLHKPARTQEESRNRLADLLWTLHDKGLEFTVFSQRPDGLWDDGAYLTTTEKTFREIARVPVNPAMLEEWTGSVVVMRMANISHHDTPQDIWGEQCLVHDGFLFFGDPVLIGKIRQLLDEGN